MYRLCVLLVAASTAVGCSKESEVPQAVAVAVSAPQDSADKEVLVASNPSGAKLILKGAEVGTTPMKLLVRGDTNVVLELEGYVKQAVLITPKSDPNMVVNLVAMPGGEVASGEEDTEAADEQAQADEEVEEKGSGSKPKKKAKKSAGQKEEEEESQVEEEEEAPVAEASSAAPKGSEKPKKKSYATMAQLKRDYREGKITKAEYRQYQEDIRRKRALELDAARQAYEEGKMTKTQYKEKVRTIKLKYEG